MKHTFQTISPINNSVYVERHYATESEIEEALVSANEAQRAWRSTTIAERAAICNKAVEYFIENADEIGLEITWQMGRPIRYTPFEITKGFQERANYMINIAEEALADIASPPTDGFQRFIKRNPLGNILVLAPWNYPYLTSVNAVIPAIMAGNSVILKHGTQTPLCSERYAEAFEYAGLSKGVFQFLHLTHDQVRAVISDTRIDFVAFTGSVEGGRAIQKAAANRFINLGLELGGKDPAYVRSDASLENAIENLVDGAFFNSGQSCCGIERIYVHEFVYDQFVDGFVSLTKDYKMGNPLDQDVTLGPMVKTESAKYAQSQVDDAISKGAKSLINPNYWENHKNGSPYMAPQVIVDVNHSMDLMSEESFGPIVGIMSVKDDDEAVALMNDSQYGLTASIWTRDIERGIQLGNDIETGTFFLNRCDYLDPTLAWTGVKNSGRGCTLSALGYESLTRPKSFHIKLES